LRFFDPACMFTKDNAVGNSKVESLRTVVGRFGIGPSECLYVGDQPADWHAARDVGTRFLGVTYGWGISKEDREFPTVNEVAGIGRFVRQTNAAVLAG
jgi:phosphoglycolate phosphatase-like HAD superfamily hydrolase